jgi:catechol 2,3-dioxygenase-like lactoylglutathione lyase family enzyme
VGSIRRCLTEKAITTGLVRLFACILITSLLAQARVKRPRILGISHVAFDVSNLSKARAFYESFLRFQEYGVLRWEDGSIQGVQENGALLPDDGSIRMVFIKVNNLQHIELFVAQPPPGRGRLNHVAFYTNNAEEMRDYLASRGVKVPQRVGKGKSGDLNFMIEDNEGHRVEIVQYEAGGWVMRDRGKFMPATRVSRYIMHMGFPVGSLQKSLQFYHGILGFREFWRGSANGRILSWVDMRVPNGQDYVEFMLYGGHYPSLKQLGGMEHFCLEVPDVHKTVAELESRPAFKTYGRKITVSLGHNHHWLANLFDPDGTRIELMEPGTYNRKPVPPSTAPPPR